MKKVFFLIVIIGLVFVVGCSSTSKLENIYKGLDAIETYSKACDYFAENVTYVKYQHIEYYMDQDLRDESEVYAKNGSIMGKIAGETIYGEEYQDIWFWQTYQPIENKMVMQYPLICNLNFYSEEDQYNLYLNSDHLLEDNTASQGKRDKKYNVPFATRLTDQEFYNIKYSKRDDLEDNILITLRAEFKSKEDEEKKFCEYRYTLNKEGLISDQEVFQYKDPNFTILLKKSEVKYTNYNKKKDLNVSGLIKEFKKYEGKKVTEVNYLFDFENEK